MKGTIILTSILLGISCGQTFGQSKLSARDILRLNRQTLQHDSISPLRRLPANGTSITATVTLSSPDDVAILEEEGFDVVSSCGRAAIVRLTRDRLEVLRDLECVFAISLGRTADTMTDLQHSTTSLQELKTVSPSICGVPLTGKGVVTGIFDSGFDINHVNFLDSEGKRRIKRLWFYNADGESYEYYGVRFQRITTDNPMQTHGTHVLGIMSGNYDGNVEYAYLPSMTASEALYTTGANPFGGVAPEADILIACGSLYLYNIVDGVQHIVDHAKKEGKPAVVNLSVGLQQGSHDGLDPDAVYLSELGKEAIIVVASGNDGLAGNVISHTFTKDQTEIKTLIVPEGAFGYDDVYGQIDIWGSDPDGYEVALQLYDTVSKQMLETYPLQSDTESGAIYLSSADAGDILGTWHEPKFDNTFIGSYVGYASGIQDYNRRANMFIEYKMNHSRPNVRGRVLALTIKGKPGTSVDLYCYSSDTNFGSKGLDGWTEPTACGTINDIACADNVLVVGSYNNRVDYGSLSGRVTHLPADKGMTAPGEISGFSSYGYRFGGEPLPHVCAPGAGVISSYSGPYVEAYNLTAGMMSARTVDLPKEHYWSVESGTSMAAPFVSGVIALWLQANPDLTIDEVKEVIAATSLRDECVEASDNGVNWGAGKIDPLAGLQYILANYPNAVDNIPVEDLFSVSIVPGTAVSVRSMARDTVSATLLSPDGATVAKASGHSEAIIPTDRLAKGVYVLTITDGERRVAKKIRL